MLDMNAETLGRIVKSTPEIRDTLVGDVDG